MLRTGIISLVLSSVMVALRFNEIGFFQSAQAKVVCLSGLLSSFGMFLSVFLRSAHIQWARGAAPSQQQHRALF